MDALLIKVIRSGRWRPRFENGAPLQCPTLQEAYAAMESLIARGELVCCATRGTSFEALAVLDGDGETVTMMSRGGYRKVALSPQRSMEVPPAPRDAGQQSD